ncbi:Ror [Carabus blaptoides fortunei]
MQLHTIIAVLIHTGYGINLTDYSQCKLTHMGLEFAGETDTTEGGVRCESWLAKSAAALTDSMFPGRSIVDARNYCRNPTQSVDGPWCYSMDPELLYDVCMIPLCRYTECRLTGPGMEYAGRHNRSVTDNKCLKWDKHRKKVLDPVTTKYYEQRKYSKRKFPDETRSSAKNYCRNPDGDTAGPWCFVKTNRNVVKQYCDIAMCQMEPCTTFTKNVTTTSNIYTHYTELNKRTSSFRFGLKLWNSDSLINASASIVLSLFPLPLNEEEMNMFRTSLVVYISNTQSALAVGNADVVDYEPTMNVIHSTAYTYFTISWDRGYVSLRQDNSTKPLFLAEYKYKKHLFGLRKGQFFWYSIHGDHMLWTTDDCDEMDQCTVHTTSEERYERFYPLRKSSNPSFDLKFHVRSTHAACIVFQTTPVHDLPRIRLTLYDTNNSTTISLYQTYETAVELGKITVLNLLNYWQWHEFTVTLFTNTIQVYHQHNTDTQLLLEVKHEFISHLRWFSPASIHSASHWMFYCSPDERAQPPKPFPPECVLNTDEAGYKGHQDVTDKGQMCLPWTHSKDVVNKIDKKTVLSYWNYCRDLHGEKNVCEGILSH